MDRPLTGMAWYADIDGEDGNAYVILASVGRIVRETMGRAEEQKFLDAAKSSDYSVLLAVARSYVDIRVAARGTVVAFDAESSCDQCSVYHMEGHPA